MRTLAGVLVCLCAGTVAAAEDARTAFETATRRYDVGDFDKACSGFRRAYDLEPRTGLLINMGICERRRGNLRDAVALFRRYLLKEPGSLLARTVQRLLAETEIEARRVEEIALPDFDGNLYALDGVDDDPKQPAVPDVKPAEPGRRPTVDPRDRLFDPWSRRKVPSDPACIALRKRGIMLDL